MKVERAGVWLDRFSSAPELWMVAKLPMNIIRAINAGAAVSLCAWVVEVDEKQVAVRGLRVDDDPQHPCFFYGPCRSAEQVEDLRALLTATSFPLQLHNEIFLPILHANCVTVPELARSVLNLLLPARDCPTVEWRERALDAIKASLEPDATTADARIRARCVQPLTIERMQSLRSYVLGSGLVYLGDKDEGNELERLAFQAFEFLCPFGAFHQPQVEHKGNRRELCDVLAVSRVREVEDEGVFVVQSKVASMTAEGLTRSTTRRASSIQANIMSAIGQLKGAIRRLQAGALVSRADGTPVEVDLPHPELTEVIEQLNLYERANKVGHGIVLVSEMHDGVDWKEVARKLFAARNSTKYFFHVLDLRELQLLVTYSHGRPAVFEDHLLRRWKLMVQHESGLVRSHFLP